MQSGKLRHLITIEQPDATVDTAGQDSSVWTTFRGGVWASVKQPSGVTDEERGRSAAQGRFIIKIRYITGVNPSMRISTKINGASVIINIESALGDVTDKRFMIITGTQEING